MGKHLACSEKGTSGKTVIFIHQSSGSSDIWRQQLSDPQLKAHSLICIDLPGHGVAPREDFYSLPAVAASLLDAIHETGETDYVLAGISISCNLIAEIAPQLKGCKGIFLTGAGLIGGTITPADVMLPFEQAGVLFEEVPSEADLVAYQKALTCFENDTLLHSLCEAFRSTDAKFRTGMAGSLGKGEWSDEISNLANAGLPVALIYGAEERIINTDRISAVQLPKWRNEIQRIPAAGHLAHLDQPEKFNRLLREFLDEIFAPVS